MRPFSPTGLYWSNRGNVLCPEHAFQVLDEDWDNERWQPLPESSQGSHGMRYQCKQCSPNGTAVIHPRSMPSRIKTA